MKKFVSHMEGASVAILQYDLHPSLILILLIFVPLFKINIQCFLIYENIYEFVDVQGIFDRSLDCIYCADRKSVV